MLYEISLRRIPAQKFLVILDGQNCYLNIFYRNGKTYCGLSIDDRIIWNGMLCNDRTPLKNSKLHEFKGNLVFIDANGKDDPIFTEFGARFFLCYYTDDMLLPENYQTPIILLPGVN